MTATAWRSSPPRCWPRPARPWRHSYLRARRGSRRRDAARSRGKRRRDGRSDRRASHRDRMSEKRAGEATVTSDREILLTRVFDAPRELVFKVWTDPEHVGRWWGPRGFTNTIHEMDVRPGGVWRFTMHGPDGVDYLNRIVFIEVARPERLV